LLAILGIGALQINGFLDAIFAKIADPSGPAYLWYAIRLYQLPLALFSVAITASAVPAMSRAFQNGFLEKYRNFLSISVRRSLVLMVSFTFFLFFLGGASINLLFGRGAFLQAARINTLYCLFGYSIGLVFASLTLILSAYFYAKKNYLIPTKGAVFSVILNILLNTFFVFVVGLKSQSIAIATSISSIFNFLFLYYYLRRDFEVLDRKVFISFFKTVFSNILAISFVVFINNFVKEPSINFIVNGDALVFSSNFFVQIKSFLILGISYFSVFMISSFLVRNEDLLDFLKIGRVSLKREVEK
jgi:putative peptidoglycan lipid II flippase